MGCESFQRKTREILAILVRKFPRCVCDRGEEALLHACEREGPGSKKGVGMKERWAVGG